MGTRSYVLAGTAGSETQAFCSACHGAGRAMSRHAGAARWHGRQVVDELAGRGILIRSPSLRGVAEEAPGAYKDVDAVVDAAERQVSRAGGARRADGVHQGIAPAASVLLGPGPVLLAGCEDGSACCPGLGSVETIPPVVLIASSSRRAVRRRAFDRSPRRLNGLCHGRAPLPERCPSRRTIGQAGGRRV